MADKNPEIDLVRKTTVSRFYRAWGNMKSRCSNPKDTNYERYGGRGITVCNKWQSFDGFIDDMYESWNPNLSLDRIDNNGNYCKANCRWATRTEQSNNMRSVPKHTYNGMTKTLAEWARFTGIKPSTLRQRFYGLKWDLETCLTTPLGGRNYGR